jgi:hypothetical protein
MIIIFKFALIFANILLIDYISCQQVTLSSSSPSTTPYNIPCQSKYTPFFNGTCQPSSNCLGATLTEICTNSNYVCCIEDKGVTSGTNSNTFITLARYLKFLGDTPRNRKLYYLFAKSISDAGITTCHQTAVYFAQLRGESKNLGLFEEPIATINNQIYDASIGNNATGDSIKYRGRGALLLRGKGFYANATLQVPSELKLVCFLFKVNYKFNFF